MRINVKDPSEFTVEAVRRLVASKDDSQHRQLRVSEDGYLYLSDVIGNLQLEGTRFTLETTLAGNDYTGKNAAADDDYVTSIYDTVKKHWEEGTRGLVDD